MKIFLIRHPQPSEAAGVCYGRCDLQVSPEALAQAAHAVRATLPQWLIDTTPIYSSPATRCLVLARALSGARAPSIAMDLREIDFGTWEGLRWDAVPRHELTAWAEDVWRYRPGGAESAQLVAMRWRRWAASLGDVDSVVAITHAGLIRVALYCRGLLKSAAFATAPIGYGSVHCIDLEASTSP